MKSINLGSPNLFLKGIAEVYVTDFTTGNIVGYSKLASESAVTSSVNLGEITAGVGNPLVMTIPDTTRLTGSLTSQAFSLQQRSLVCGGNIEYNAIAPVCENITASGATLTVTNAPAKAYGQKSSDTYGWCYVKEVGAESYIGNSFALNLETKQIENFVATEGKSYVVRYFTAMTSAQVLNIPTNFNPTVATVRIKYVVYAQQNNSVTNGTIQGYLYLVVPRAQFTGNVGLDANQTTNATTDYSWQALAPETDDMDCTDCTSAGSDYAYYVYVPCEGETAAVDNLAVIGGTIAVATGASAQIPVMYVMENGSLEVPDYSALEYTVEPTGIVTVANGVVSGVETGEAVVTISGTGAGGKTITANCSVTVS